MHRISTKTEILFFLVSVRNAPSLCAVSFYRQQRQSLCIDSNECISSILWGLSLLLVRRLSSIDACMRSPRRSHRHGAVFVELACELHRRRATCQCAYEFRMRTNETAFRPPKRTL